MRFQFSKLNQKETYPTLSFDADISSRGVAGYSVGKAFIVFHLLVSIQTEELASIRATNLEIKHIISFNIQQEHEKWEKNRQ